MGSRRLVFLNHAGDAPPPDDSVDYAVLDSAWTPPPDGRSDLIPIRPTLWTAIRDRNLHDETLAALDEWADRANLVNRFTIDGVSWWAHVRGFVRLDLYEMLVWRIVLDALAPPGRYDMVEVPSDRPNLLAALQAPPIEEAARGAAGSNNGPPDVTVRSARTGARRFGGGKPSAGGLARRPWYRRAISRSIRVTRRAFDVRGRMRVRAVETRLRRLVHDRPDVLAIVRGDSFHLVRGEEGEERFDPIVTPVVRRLSDRGKRSAVVVTGLADDETADGLLSDDAPIPFEAVANLLLDSADRTDDRAELARRLEGIEAIALPAERVDLGPPMAAIVGGLDRWLARQLRVRLVAERLIGTLRPRMLLTGWEAARTAWLAAAKSKGVPAVAIQHGVIYRNSPDYYRPHGARLVRPELTCTFGEFERGLLVDECGYAPGSVVATGSPRISNTSVEPLATAARAEIRRGLGVARGDRIMVISGARHAIGEELQSTTIFAQLLDGPLPGVHVVIKLHPEEERGDHYPELLNGLAAAGGWLPPPITIVRDIDLFELLRAADAHLGIYSTVLTDAVMAGTPNMIAVGQAWSDLLGYVAAGVAEPVSSVDEVRAFMGDPRPPSADARAAFLEAHLASSDGAGRIADALGAMLGRTDRAA